MSRKRGNKPVTAEHQVFPVHQCPTAGNGYSKATMGLAEAIYEGKD